MARRTRLGCRVEGLGFRDPKPQTLNRGGLVEALRFRVPLRFFSGSCGLGKASFRVRLGVLLGFFQGAWP